MFNVANTRSVAPAHTLGSMSPPQDLYTACLKELTDEL